MSLNATAMPNAKPFIARRPLISWLSTQVYTPIGRQAAGSEKNFRNFLKSAAFPAEVFV